MWLHFISRDTPDVDIVGCNLYQRYIDRYHMRLEQNDIQTYDPDANNSEVYDPELPASRQIPNSADWTKQSVERIESLLVCTGVYNPEINSDVEGDEKNYMGHRDFPRISQLYQPTKTFQDVNEAIDYILEKEQYYPSAVTTQ